MPIRRDFFQLKSGSFNFVISRISKNGFDPIFCKLGSNPAEQRIYEQMIKWHDHELATKITFELYYGSNKFSVDDDMGTQYIINESCVVRATQEEYLNGKKVASASKIVPLPVRNYAPNSSPSRIVSNFVDNSFILDETNPSFIRGERTSANEYRLYKSEHHYHDFKVTLDEE